MALGRVLFVDQYPVVIAVDPSVAYQPPAEDDSTIKRPFYFTTTTMTTKATNNENAKLSTLLAQPNKRPYN